MTIQPNIRAIVFDLDGTLVDSMGEFANMAARLISNEFKVSFEEAHKMYRDTSGVPFFEQLAKLFPCEPDACKKISDQFEQEKIQRLGQDPLYPEVTDALDQLRHQGYLLIVSSNNFLENIKQSLGESLRFFDMVLGCDSNIKKGQAHFTMIQKRFNLERSEILFVGDSLYDAQMAKSCHVNFMARWGTFDQSDFQSLDLTIQGFSSLMDCVPTPLKAAVV